MARVKYVSELKLGDVISYLSYGYGTVEHCEAMLVELEPRKNYFWYKFRVITGGTPRHVDRRYLYLQCYSKYVKVNFLYNIKEIIECHSATHH